MRDQLDQRATNTTGKRGISTVEKCRTEKCGTENAGLENAEPASLCELN